VVIVADAVSGERLIAVVVEPQGQASDDKDQSWPVYATTARKANKCARAVQQGRAAGEADGKAEGIAQGEAKRGATDILRLLKSRGLSPTRAQRELIESCDDLGQLDTWFDRALTATTLATVFED
jgi:hypothetical protein